MLFSPLMNDRAPVFKKNTRGPNEPLVKYTQGLSYPPPPLGLVFSLNTNPICTMF
jgi:hypothetical protein